MQETKLQLDTATVTRGITYLYRWWLQAKCNMVPEAYIRKGGVATLVCSNWALVASAEPIDCQELRGLESDLRRPIFACCPFLPPDSRGIDLRDGTATVLPDEAVRAVALIKQEREFLLDLGEENPDRDEWWKTRDAGEFKLWKKANKERLLLYPTGGQVYGFSITTGTDEGYFFFRSKSCSEEGKVTKNGQYKMSDHALPTGRKVSNLDLLFCDSSVLLLRLLPTGAGFKVFPRRVLGAEGSLS